MNDVESCYNYCMVFISENDEEISHNFAMPRLTGVKINLSLVAMTCDYQNALKYMQMRIICF